MAQIKTHKFVAALPPELEADAIYFVRSGSGFDLYVTNHSGTIVAYGLNGPVEYAKLNSPALTGTPTAPTPDLGSKNNQVATTDFVSKTIATGLSEEYKFASNSLELPVNQLTPISTTSTLFRYNRWRISIGSWTARKARFLISNILVSANTVTANSSPIEFEGLFIEINGVVHPITVGGQTGFTIASGAQLWTDPLTVEIPANADVFLRSARKFTLNQAWTGTAALISPQIGDVAQHSSTSLLTVANGTVAPTNPQVYSPRPPICAMVAKGYTGGPVALVIGSSGAYGTGWNSELTDNRREAGYIRRGLGLPAGGRITGMILATSGGTFNNTINSLLPWLKTAIDNLGEVPFNYVHCQLGLNDLSTLPTMQGHVSNLRNALNTNFGQVPFVLQTLTPTTSGANTNKWTDEAGQVFSSTAFGPDPSYRSQFNSWVKGNPNGIIGLDIASVLEGATKSKIKVPTFVSTLAAPASIGATTLVLNHAPPIGTMLVLEPGTPNFDYGDDDRLVVASVSGTGPYTVSLVGGDYTPIGDPSLTKAHSTNAVVVSSNSYDGIHFSTRTQMEMAEHLASMKGIIRDLIPSATNQLANDLDLRIAEVKSAIEANARPIKALNSFCSGKPANNEVIGGGIAPYSMTIDSFSCKAHAVVAATASTVFTIKKNNTNIGTVTFSAAGTVGVFSITTTTVAVDNLITIHAPASADATLADITIQLRGT